MEERQRMREKRISYQVKQTLGKTGCGHPRQSKPLKRGSLTAGPSPESHWTPSAKEGHLACQVHPLGVGGTLISPGPPRHLLQQLPD